MSWLEAKRARMRMVLMRFPLLFTDIYRASTVWKPRNGSGVRVRDPQWRVQDDTHFKQR